MEIITGNKDIPEIDINFEGEKFLEHLQITTKYWSTFGRCYSIQLKDHVLELGVRGIKLKASMGVYIYFGYPGQFMHTNYKSKVYYENNDFMNII